jgi:hypothetical protein
MSMTMVILIVAIVAIAALVLLAGGGGPKVTTIETKRVKGDDAKDGDDA